MSRVDMDLQDGWYLNESFVDAKGNKVYRLMDNRSGKPIALCEYPDLPKEITVRRAIRNYEDWGK